MNDEPKFPTIYTGDTRAENEPIIDTTDLPDSYPQVEPIREAGQNQYLLSNPPNDTENFLKQWWKVEGHNPMDFSLDKAKSEFAKYWERELNKLADVQKFYLDISEDTPDWLKSEKNIMEYFAPLIEEQGIAVLPQAFLDTYNYLEQDNFTYDQDSPIIIDAKAFLNAHASENDQPLPYDGFEHFNENLAYEQFVEDGRLDTDRYLDFISMMLFRADRDVLASLAESNPDLWLDVVSETYSPHQVTDSFVTYFEQLSLDEQVQLSRTLASDYYETADEMDVTTAPALHLLEQTQAYSEAQALDQLRAIVFDPSWNPEVEAQKLAILAEKIEEMETSILGVDIAWVQQSFKAYHKTMSEYEAWRSKMLPLMQEVELQMLAREDEEVSPFWWLEIVGSVLFEPIDWLLTARDLLNGEWGALIGFLLLIPASIRNIADARRYMKGATGDLIRKYLGTSDKWKYIFPPNNSLTNDRNIIISSPPPHTGYFNPKVQIFYESLYPSATIRDMAKFDWSRDKRSLSMRIQTKERIGNQWVDSTGNEIRAIDIFDDAWHRLNGDVNIDRIEGVWHNTSGIDGNYRTFETTLNSLQPSINAGEITLEEAWELSVENTWTAQRAFDKGFVFDSFKNPPNQDAVYVYFTKPQSSE